MSDLSSGINAKFIQISVTEDRVEQVCFRRLTEIQTALKYDADKEDDHVVVFHFLSHSVGIRVHSIETSGIYRLVIGEFANDGSMLFRAFLKTTPNDQGNLGKASWFKQVCLICGEPGHMGLESERKIWDVCKGYCYGHRHPVRRDKSGKCQKCLEQDKLAH